MRDEIRRRVGYDPFQAPAALRALIEVTSVETGLEANLQVTDADGHKTGRRTLRSKSTDCVELSSALQLALSIAIDPMLLLAPAPAIAPRAPAAVLPPPAPPAAPEAVRTPLVVEVIAGPEVSLGQGPGVGLGGNVGAAIRWPRFSLGLEGHADFSTGVPADIGRVTSSQYFASFVPCFRPSGFSLCAVGAIGVQNAFGIDLVNATSTVLPFAGVGVRAAYDAPTDGRFAVRFQVEGLVPVTTTQFTVGDTVAWQGSPVSGSASVMAVGRF